MDLNFTPEEQAFREQIRAWVAENLPKDISNKVHNALRLSKDDLQRWAKILGAKGWLGYGWPKEFGGPGWDAIERHLFEEECALAGAPRIVPFGPVMVAPVIMAFGTPAQRVAGGSRPQQQEFAKLGRRGGVGVRFSTIVRKRVSLG